MKLKKLLQDVQDYEVIKGSLDVDVRGVHFDSRAVKRGDLFIAIKGVDVDGHAFMQNALEKGVTAIVLEDEQHIPNNKEVTVVKVKNSRKALAHIAAAYYDHPSKKLIVIGVTGTDGKTTTSTLIHHILQYADLKVGLITSINAIIGDKMYETGFHTTTPDALSIQKYLKEMVKAGCEYAVIETSSHGLAQYRVEACEYDVAVLTNITSEHLDFHKSQEEYRKAKAHLFELLSVSYKKKNVPKVSILNIDDPNYIDFKSISGYRLLSYGLNKKADFWAYDVSNENAILSFFVHSPEGKFKIESPLLGNYNVYNILAACSVAYSQQIPINVLVEAIKTMNSIRGRMELITHEEGDFRIIIDFAHTANALEQALKTAHTFTTGKIHVVFGSAGLRDVKKRSEMGIVAGKFADKIYLTAEDPRTEDVNVIIDEIAQGCREQDRTEGEEFFRIPDRTKAIEEAILNAKDNDTVLCCGKAHETTMCYGKEELPWSEYEVVQKALEKRGNLS